MPGQDIGTMPASTSKVPRALVWVNAQRAVKISIDPAHGAILHHNAMPVVRRRPLQSGLPPPLAQFCNREAEQQSLQAVLTSGQHIWLAGPDGSGRSALLHQATSNPMSRLLADGTVVLTHRDAPLAFEDLLQQLFGRFFVSDTAVKLPQQHTQQSLGRLQALIVLDRLPLTSDELERLTSILSQSAVFIAANTPPPSHVQTLTLENLPADDALELCKQITRVDTSLEQTTALLRQICTTLENLPLPVMLMSRLIGNNIVRLRKFVSALDQMQDIRDPMERVVAIILAELSSNERSVLAAMVGAGGGTLTVPAVVAISQRPAEIVNTAIARLTILGIVEQQQSRLHIPSPSLHQAFQHALQPVQEQQRAAAYYAAAIEHRSGDPAWVQQELSNLLAAVQTALTHGDMAQVGMLARGLQPFLVLTGMWHTWAQTIAWAEQAARATSNRALYAWALHERGTHAGLHGDWHTAGQSLQEAQRLRILSDDEPGAAASQQNMVYLGLQPPAPSAAQTATTYQRTLRTLTPGQWFIGALPFALLLVSLLLGLLFPERFFFASIPEPTPTPTSDISPTAVVLPIPIVTPDSGPPTLPAVPTIATTSPTTRPPYPEPTTPPTATFVPTDTVVAQVPTAVPPQPAPPTAAPPVAPYPDVPTTAPATATPAPVQPTATAAPTAEPVASPTAAEAATSTPEPVATATPTATATPELELAAPVLSAPDDAATLACDEPVTLSWETIEAGDVTLQYTWGVEEITAAEDEDNQDDEDEPFRQSGATEDTSTEITDLPCDTEYRWRVRAEATGNITGPLSAERTFQIAPLTTPTPTPSPAPDDSAPDAPELLAPNADQIFACSDTITLAWSDVDDPDGIDRYEWEVDISTSGRSGGYSFRERGIAVSPSVTISDVSSECRDDETVWYRWRVRAVDNDGSEGNYSPYDYFQVSNS